MTTDRPKLHDATQLKYQVAQGNKGKKLNDKGQLEVTGKSSRKTSRAIVTLTPGSGTIRVNNRDYTEYFAIHSQRFKVSLPLVLTLSTCLFDVDVKTWGGGLGCQADASMFAMSKALVRYDYAHHDILKKSRLLLVDYRQVERKKIGLYKARRKFTYKRR